MTKNERERFTKSDDKEAKKAISDYEYMRYKAEANAYMKLSQERPLTDKEFKRYKYVCEQIGIKV